MPWPPATNTPGTRVAPTSGLPSGETGRGPTHMSVIPFQSTPVSSGRADLMMASMRRCTSGSSGPRNSMVPATRSLPWYGVHATRTAGR